MVQTRQSGELGREQQTSAQQRFHGSQGNRERSQSSINLAAIALRGIGDAYDIQCAATRLMLQTQARVAMAFGWPDFSPLFQVANGRTKRVFSHGTEQLLSTTQQATDVFNTVQRQIGEVIEFNAENLAQNWERGIEELSSQTEESLQQISELTREQLDEAKRAAESLSEGTREAVREGGERFRQSIRESGEQVREASNEQGDAMRKEGERAANAARGSGEEEEEPEKTSRRGSRAA